MMRFLETAQLPEGSVSQLALGDYYCNEFSPVLERLGIEILPLKGAILPDPRLSGHADLMLLHLGGPHFWAAEGLNLHKSIPICNYVNLINNDAALNLCLLGDHWIGSEKYAAWQPETYKRIAVKQRYARCSTCIVDKNSIITSDHGIAQVAEVNGIHVLEIRPGYIQLDGFYYGFIGGASFKIAKDKLAFTGNLRHHPDEYRIRLFLSERKVEPVFLSEEPLKDIGSAVLITENIDLHLP